MATSVSPHFVLEEFVPRDLFSGYGIKSYRFFDPRLIKIAEELRAQFGPIIINNWHTGGTHQYRGFRPPDCTEGAKFSAHKRGMAIDCEMTGADEKDAFAKVLANKAKWTALGVTTLEDAAFTPGWLHVAVENWNKPGDIVVVKP